MNLIIVLKVVLVLCGLAILFGGENLLVYALTPRLPQKLMRSEGEEEIRHQFVKPGDRIVGGRPAFHGEFPYQVSLQKIGFFGSRTHYCGGAIVSDICILSAAHCLDGRGSNDIVVRLGSNTLRNDPAATEHAIRQLIPHPDYDSGTILHDIGVIKLKKRLKFKVNVNSIAVTEFKRKIATDTYCIASGWGSTREGSAISKILMHANVPIINETVCKEMYGDTEIFDTMMCAGFSEGGIDSCQGDSGGPLICDGKLSGIVSWGVGCARPKYPGVYTEVSYYSRWVESLDCFKPPENTTTSMSHNTDYPSLLTLFAQLMGLASSARSVNETMFGMLRTTKLNELRLNLTAFDNNSSSMVILNNENA